MKKNQLTDILELARSKDVTIELADAVKKGAETTGNDSKRWQNDQVAEFKIEPGKGQHEPIVLNKTQRQPRGWREMFLERNFFGVSTHFRRNTPRPYAYPGRVHRVLLQQTQYAPDRAVK